MGWDDWMGMVVTMMDGDGGGDGMGMMAVMGWDGGMGGWR